MRYLRFPALLAGLSILVGVGYILYDMWYFEQTIVPPLTAEQTASGLRHVSTPYWVPLLETAPINQLVYLSRVTAVLCGLVLMIYMAGWIRMVYEIQVGMLFGAAGLHVTVLFIFALFFAWFAPVDADIAVVTLTISSVLAGLSSFFACLLIFWALAGPD